MTVRLVELAECGSTQDEVVARLEAVAPRTLVAVRADSQLQGRGREGRIWQDGSGSALLLSVGVRGPLPTSLLEDLPRRVVASLVDAVATQAPSAREHLAWQAPNDIVDAMSGAKVAGVLVDVRSLGGSVERIVVGIGCNVDGSPFATADGRAATTLSTSCGIAFDRSGLVDELVAGIARELGAGS